MKIDNLNLKEELKGKRINLKIIQSTFENAKIFFDLVEKNRIFLREWFEWVDKVKTPEDYLKFLFEVEESQKTDEKEFFYGIFLGDVLLGSISIFSVDFKKKKSGEIGYWLSSEFNGKGYMSEALKLIEDEFFENNGLNRIVIRCNFKNLASKKVAENNNYFFEGVSREDRFNYFTNKLEDSLNFSKLKKEYYEN